MTTELSFTDVTLTFPDGKDRVTAVNNVSFTLKPGELIAITGPSGSGKSSLLALAATLITPDSGSIMLGDTELARLSGKQAAECRRNRIGIVFQQSNLIPSLTALEQLEMMRHLGPPWRQKTQRKKVRSRGMELLERLDLGDCADRRVGALSGGTPTRQHCPCPDELPGVAWLSMNPLQPSTPSVPGLSWSCCSIWSALKTWALCWSPMTAMPPTTPTAS